MSLVKRLDMLTRLRTYMLGNQPDWEAAKEKAYWHNGWFIPAFIDVAVEHIIAFLEPANLQQWIGKYDIPATQAAPKTIGLVLPGNIPLAGIYDVICVYLAGHRQRIKLSPKDEVLMKHLVQALTRWDDNIASEITFHEMLKGCDAYIAIGGTASSPFERYLNKYPCIVRPATRMEALLRGTESREELELLADDVFTYFGQGSLNVTKLHVPANYDFIPLLKVFEKYAHLVDLNKYKNNYDYQLSLLILNKEFYMTNGCILLTENAATRSPVARLNFEYYNEDTAVLMEGPFRLADNSLSGKGYAPFGRAGQSVICGDINGMDSLKFLLEL